MKKKKKKEKRELKKAVLRILLNPLIVIESTFRSLLFPSRIEIELLSRGWYKFHGVPISLIHGLAVFSKAPPPPSLSSQTFHRALATFNPPTFIPRGLSRCSRDSIAAGK